MKENRISEVAVYFTRVTDLPDREAIHWKRFVRSGDLPGWLSAQNQETPSKRVYYGNKKLRSVQQVRHVLDGVTRGLPVETSQAEARAIRGTPELCRSSYGCYYPEASCQRV